MSTTYGTHPGTGLPETVQIYEVGARDGLQNEKNPVPTAVKTEFITRLAAAGLTTIEATSFVHPKWVPQLADAADVVDALTGLSGVRLPVLVPNLAGLARALEHGVTDIAVFVSATETFSQKNLNCSVTESLTTVEKVITEAKATAGEQISIRGYVSMCFGDPWEGQTDIAAVVDVGSRLLEMGCYELSLGDTIGVATPGHVEQLIGAFDAARHPAAQLAVHFHDTYGQALANTLAALQTGVTTVDSSAGGLGGCPYAKSATGNLATEDLVWQLHGLGIRTGVDLDALVRTSAWMAGELGRPSPSRVVRALTSDGAP
ncbi:hydroxymethylglutaryl-CoA lyase [Rhodococcus koreensis]|uniref:hydroxymethylglutaryl-CoA lyase n=1 Tax=Rhodococcus koreensis TaxID=99653 RepID=UPI0036DBC464